MSEFEGDWRDKAECVTVDPELFFPIGSEKSPVVQEQIEKAKRVCGRCTVQVVCLEYALSTGQNDGIWGGLTEDERRELKRRARQRKFLDSVLH